MPQIHPQLSAEVKRLLDSSANVAALVTVQMPRGGEVNLAEAVELLTLQATNESGMKPNRVVLFVRLNAFAVEAPAEFLDAMLKQSLVSAATLAE